MNRNSDMSLYWFICREIVCKSQEGPVHVWWLVKVRLVPSQLLPRDRVSVSGLFHSSGGPYSPLSGLSSPRYIPFSVVFPPTDHGVSPVVLLCPSYTSRPLDPKSDHFPLIICAFRLLILLGTPYSDLISIGPLEDRYIYFFIFVFTPYMYVGIEPGYPPVLLSLWGFRYPWGSQVYIPRRVVRSDFLWSWGSSLLNKVLTPSVSRSTRLL